MLYARRTIWMDGRSLPKDPDPTPGMDIRLDDGKEDTLIVDTIGLDERSWLNGGGYPHSDAVHIVERFRRPDDDSLELTTTIDDSKAYTKPWAGNPRVYLLKPKYELLESPCVPDDEAVFSKECEESGRAKAK